MAEVQARDGSPVTHDKLLFWGCFMSLIATAFGFVVRSMVINEWGVEFGLTKTQQGEIFGAGLWPFAVSIVLFSLIIDKIGYGRAMIFAFICHVTYGIMTVFATGYEMLYAASVIVALGNGTVEAVINPVVATMFSKEKTKWLNILHAGWPGGLVFGGILAIYLADVDWRIRVGLIFIPTALYGLMLLGRKFPVHERVAAGVSFRDMLKEAGAIGAFIVIFLMTWELGRVFEVPNVARWAIVIVLTVAYGLYVRSLGRPLFIFLLLIMMPLATTELGTDSWITPLMEGSMAEIGYHAGWVLVYTSFIMMMLRFFAGPIVHRLSPLGLLATCAVIAAVGLFLLSGAEGAVMILIAATVYGVGKTFFWPTMLGIVAEQFPRGGALTLNAIAGVGMLSVGIVGAVFLGTIQDRYTNEHLQTYDTEQGTTLYPSYVTLDKVGIFGAYTAVDPEAVAAAPEDQQTILGEIMSDASKNALRVVAIFPIIMFICYILLILYFRSKGGYKPVHLEEEAEPAH